MADDPVRDAWEAAGRPPVPCPGAGQCARCGTAGPAAPWRGVLSGNFGDWDKLPFRQSGMFCEACAWALGHKPLRTRAHVIGPGRPGQAGPALLRAVLAGPVAGRLLVSVPVAGKKHIVPWAPYGVVVTDHEQLAWTAADCARLETLAALRALGFGEQALGEQAPPWPLLRRLDGAQRLAVMSGWPGLSPWRRRPSYLAVACRATRTPKDDKESDA